MLTADPNIAFVFLILGVLGVQFEFSAPGLILPGVAGGVLASLGFSALLALPVTTAGTALLFSGVVLLVLEARLTARGILGMGGAAAMVTGAVWLIDGPAELRIRWSTALAATLPFAATTIFLMKAVLLARANKAIRS